MRNRLFKVYCSSLYGCELWDLDKRNLSDLCVARRNGLLRRSPQDAHCNLLY